MKSNTADLLPRIPGPVTAKWPQGEPFAGAEHRFVEFTPDFATWVVFWGPPGGEAAATGV